MRPILAAILILLTSPAILQLGVTAQSMATSTNPHAPILIIGNSGFTQANGVTGGTGVSADPYVIGQWQISAPSGNGITIFNTTSYFVIQGVNVSSTLRGIYLHNVTNGLVQNSAISYSTYGVLAERSSSTSISNNVLSNNLEGVLIQDCTKLSVIGDKISSSRFQQTRQLVVKSSPGSIISKNNIWWSGDAVSLENTSNALVTGNNMSYNAGTALSLSSSPNANLTGNYFARNIYGVSLTGSDNVSITSSAFYGNNAAGIRTDSNNTTISKNVIALNGVGLSCCQAKAVTISGNNFTLDGLGLGYSPYQRPSYTIATDNLVNGKPLRFYAGCSNLDINGISAGELILLNCNNVRITNLAISYTVAGIQLINVNNTLIDSNSVNSNTNDGISLTGCNNITVTGNNLSNNIGLALISSPFAVTTTSLTAYHNNLFFDEISDPSSFNDRFDNGYPSGGNYWARYKGVDNCSGPNQNICPSPDGIGDTPYVPSCQYNYCVRDRYPLMRPYLLAPDTSPPGWLPNMQLAVSGISQTQATLYWMRAADDVGVVSYQVYRGSTLIANISADSNEYFSTYFPGYQYQYVAGNLTAGTSYTFKIVAVDEAGNRSVQALAANISTPPPQSSPPPILSSAWWQQYWYFVALPVGAGAATLAFLLIRRRKRVPAPSSITAPDSSNPGR